MRYTVYQTYQDREYCEVEADSPEDAVHRASESADWRSCQNVEYVSSCVEEGWGL